MTDTALLRAAVFAVLLISARAQPAPAPGAENGAAPAGAQQRPPAALRAWIFPAKDAGPLDFVLGRATGEAPASLARSERGAKAADGLYSKAAPGRVTLSLKGGEKVLASSDVDLPSGAHITAVAWSSGDKWQIKLFADPPAKPGAGARPLRVLNFAGERETLLAVGGGKEVRLPAASVRELDLPAKISGLTVKVVDPAGGPPSETSLEVDLAALPLAYAVVGPNYRGRMRPEIIEGGPPRVESVVVLNVPELDPAAQAKLERERRAAARRMEREHLSGQLAILEAQIREGVNVPEDAEGIRQELRKQMKDLDKPEPAPSPASPKPPAAN